MEIDSLEIVIESSSEEAIKRVDELTEKLRQLKETFSSMPKNPFGGMGGSGDAPKIPKLPKAPKQDYSALSEDVYRLASAFGSMSAPAQKYANSLVKAKSPRKQSIVCPQ